VSDGIDRSVLALGTARMADALANSFLVVVLPLFIASGRLRGNDFGLQPAAITGIVLASFGLLNAVIQPVAGRLSDVVGSRKPFVLAGLVLLTALNLAYLLTDSYLTVLLVRVGQGVAVAITVTATVALVSEVSTRATRGRNMGVYNALRLLGFGSGPLFAGFVVSSGPYTLPGGVVLDGFDATFWVAGLGAAISGVLVMILVREPERHTADAGAFRIAVRAEEGRGWLDPIFTLGVATLVMAACIALLASIEAEVNEHLGQGPRWFGVQFSVFVLSLAAAQPMVGRMSDRFGRKHFVVWGLVALVPTTMAQGMVGEPWGMVVARLAQGLAGAMVFAPALALAGDLAGEGQSGLKLSVLTISFVLGLSVGQLAAGFLVAVDYLAPFVFGSALALAAAWLVRREVEEARAAVSTGAGRSPSSSK